MTYQTEQESFWAGEFGDDYISRNKTEQLLSSNIKFFANAFSRLRSVGSTLEFGANIGMNLKALATLFPSLSCSGIEINPTAATELRGIFGADKVYEQSILDFESEQRWDLTFTKGVLIHINPDLLPVVYDKLYYHSNRYVLVAEYYNPTPVALPYRGHDARLFKRDFAGEMMDRFPDLALVDYGFLYHRDANFPQDDITWFMLEKKSVC
jgi:pseudaminic acid biosynthesis-associated methylase